MPVDQAVQGHLTRILQRFGDMVRDEVANCATLGAVYPEIGDIHPALCRERHVQGLFAQAARQAGYFAIAECNYFVPASAGRRIDLGLWLSDLRRWLYLELEPCGPQMGFQAAAVDAQKLVDDVPTDVRDQLRGVVVYGFRDRGVERDGFRSKYEQLGTELEKVRYRKVAIRQWPLDGDAEWAYFQAGLWVVE